MTSSAGVLKHFVLAFVLAVAGYFLVYQLIEGRRTEQGPWQVAFTQMESQPPHFVINQPNLAITNVQISFPDATRSPTNHLNLSMVFDRPQPVPFEVPFGKCVLMDLRFLPGTLTFEMFGHRIELLPRALLINGQEHPWEKDMTLTLHQREQGQ
jgi:hypothetical protein